MNYAARCETRARVSDEWYGSKRAAGGCACLCEGAPRYKNKNNEAEEDSPLLKGYFPVVHGTPQRPWVEDLGSVKRGKCKITVYYRQTNIYVT